MSTSVHTKRPLESKKATIEEEEEGTPLAKRRERKPGRKPLETEAKDKRTAQNRAAQRAFRERRERKMKELEDKVKSLEMANQQSELEAKFLRSQVTNLLSELKRYNPNIYKNRDHMLAGQMLSKQGSAANSSKPANNSGVVDSSLNSAADALLQNASFRFDFPWKADSSKIPSPSSPSASPPSSTMDSSTSKTSTGTDWDNKLDASGLDSIPGNTLNLYQSNSDETSEFDFDSQFDESVSNFCSKLGMACGTRSSPVPKVSTISTRHSSSSGDPVLKQESPASKEHTELQKPDASVDTPSTSHSWNQPSFGQLGFRNDQLFDIDLKESALGDGIGSNAPEGINWNMEFPTSNLVGKHIQNPDSSFIDQNIAFPDSDDPLMKILDEEREVENPEDFDPVQALINEEPTFPLSHEQHSHSHFNANIQTDFDINRNTSSTISYEDYHTVKNLDPDDLVQDIIPSNDGKLLKCSEVWDRITAHPRYSDLDIDGLCMELRTKAKCSEKGVVVNAEDVQNVLLKHMQ